MPIDPLTAFANVATAALNFGTACVEGQTPEQKQKMWQFIIDDIERWRKRFGLDKDVPPANG